MKQLTTLLLFMASTVLLAQQNPVLVVSSGHHGSIKSVDISPNGKHVVSGGDDNLIKVYDMQLQLELNTFSGHSDRVIDVNFSKNGKYITSISKNEILIHSHPLGDLVRRIDIRKFNSEPHCYLAEDLRLYFGEDDGLQVYNVLSGEHEKTIPEIKAKKFIVTPDEKTLICTATNESGKTGIAFYSLPEGKQIDFIPVEALYYHTYDLSLDGKTLAFESKSCEVSILDLNTKKIKTTITAGVGMMNVMKLSPDAKQLISSTFDNFVRFWDANTGKKIKDIQDLSPTEGGLSMSMAIRDLDFSDDGKMSVYAYLDLQNGKQLYTVEWFNTKTMKSIGKHSGEIKLSLSISIDRTGRILSTGTIDNDMGVKCFDVAKGSQKAYIPGYASHGSGGEYMAAISFSGEKSQAQLNIYNMPSLRLFKTINIYGLGEIKISTSGQFVSLIDSKQGSNPAKLEITPIVRVWNINSGKELVHLERTLQTMPRGCLFSKNETHIHLLYPDQIETVDLTSGKVVNTVKVSVNMAVAPVISPDGTKIIGASEEGVYSIDLQTGEKSSIMSFPDLTLPQSLDLSPDKTLLAIACIRVMVDQPHRVLVYDWESKTPVCELIGHTTKITGLTIDAKNEHLYSVDNNGIIAMWDLAKCKVQSSFLAFGADDFLIISPESYYKSSKGNLANIGFRQNGSLFTFDQFDLRYNRPDKVIAAIGMASEQEIAMYNKAYVKRLARMGFSEDQFSGNLHAPEIEILNQEQLPLNTTSGSIDIEIKASDASVPLDRLAVVVNDVPIYGKMGKPLKAQNKLTHQEKLNIPLVVGVNLIQISVMNRNGTESTRFSYSIDCKKPIVKPNLYIVAIGVRTYADSSMNLTYSDKDVSDVLDLFMKDQGTSGFYNKIYSQKLTNEEVTKESIGTKSSILNQSTIDDHVVLFYSGHGLLDEQMDYFLSTYDVDFAAPGAKGLPFESFRDLIDGVSARNRLILVDACHSGEVDKDEVQHAAPKQNEELALKSKEFAAKGKKVIGLGNSFELMKELFVELKKESGATIIASSAGKEFSLESKKWENGVFTFTIKEALLERKADANGDNLISVSELKRYLLVRVKELTDGQQTPTVRSENLQHDYTLY